MFQISSVQIEKKLTTRLQYLIKSFTDDLENSYVLKFILKRNPTTY